MLLHVLIHGKRQKMSRVKAEKQLKTFLFFIVLTFDKTTSLPTHVKDQFGYIMLKIYTWHWSLVG